MNRKVYRSLTTVAIILLVALSTQSVLSQLSSESQAYRYYRDGLLLSKEGNFKDAISLLQQASRLDSSSVILKTLGDIYIQPQVREYNLAAAIYEDYLKKNPFDDRTINIVIQIFGQLNRFERAESVLERVINAGNNKPDYYSKLIDFYLKSGKLEASQNTSILYLERAGEAETACQEVAKLFIQNSMVVEGIDFFTSYVASHETDNMGIIVGILHESTKDGDAAYSAYRSVLDKNILSSLARQRLAAMAISGEQLDDAAALYDGIDFDDPSEIPVKLQIVSMYLGYDNPPHEKIQAIMNSVKDKFGVNAQVFYFLGLSQYQQGDYVNAKINVEKATQMDPKVPLYYYLMADIKFREEDFVNSITAIDIAIKLQPNFRDFYVIKGMAHNSLKQVDEAMKAYEMGLAVTSSDNRIVPTLQNNYSYILSVNEIDLIKAVDLAKKAVLAEPENSSFNDTLGWAFFKQGQFEEALIYIKKSISLDPENAEVLEHLGDVYHKQGDKINAQLYWEKALDNDKDNESIKEKIKQLQ